MTASHIQVLRAGPIQPIGLPPTATMGVTNARVLHRRILNNNNQAVGSNNSLSLLGAKRCLFGSPEPGEIQNLYKEEMRRSRDRFLQRYNYDILSDRFIGENAGSDKSEDVNENSDKCNSNQETVEDRLREDQNELNSTSNLLVNSNSCESDCDKECNLDKIQLLTITKDNSNISTAPSIPKVVPPSPAGSTTASPTFKDKKSCERLKPYSRQNLITEYYSTRKSVTLTSISHAIEVNQLPKPQKAKLHNQQQQRFQQCEDV